MPHHTTPIHKQSCQVPGMLANHVPWSGLHAALHMVKHLVDQLLQLKGRLCRCTGRKKGTVHMRRDADAVLWKRMNVLTNATIGCGTATTFVIVQITFATRQLFLSQSVQERCRVLCRLCQKAHLE